MYDLDLVKNYPVHGFPAPTCRMDRTVARKFREDPSSLDPGEWIIESEPGGTLFQ
jgi:hypothetical protein